MEQDLAQPDRATSIAQTIRSRILAWHYAPGARLLEQSLCEELQVSRSLVREALRMLEARGYLVKQPNRGYEVRQLDVRVANELYELREAIECHIVGRLAARDGISEENLQKSAKVWRDMWSEPALPESASRADYAACDRRFHEALAEELGNQTMIRELKDINDRIEIFRSIDFEQESTVRSARKAHLHIVDAIASGDVHAAVSAIRENIGHARSNIRLGLTEALGRAYFGGNQ